jgi:hypothetical protein
MFWVFNVRVFIKELKIAPRLTPEQTEAGIRCFSAWPIDLNWVITEQPEAAKILDSFVYGLVKYGTLPLVEQLGRNKQFILFSWPRAKQILQRWGWRRGTLTAHDQANQVLLVQPETAGDQCRTEGFLSAARSGGRCPYFLAFASKIICLLPRSHGFPG